MKIKVIKQCFTIYALMCCITLISACKFGKKTLSPEEVVQKWIGKEMIFPNSSSCYILGENTPCIFKSPNPFKILIYTDSTGCTGCKLRLDMWKELMKDADTSFKKKVDFLFYFYPKDKQILRSVLQRENFREQVYVNNNDDLNKINNLPTEMEYQCFLLDSNYKVLSVGNPTLNYDVWDLYKKIINGKVKLN